MKKKKNNKQSLKVIITSNKKLIIGITLGLLLSAGSVYAATILYASDETSYDDTKTSYTLGASDVQDALDKLYIKEEECNTMQITYDKGNCVTASSLPSTQTARRGANVTLSANNPTCSDGKVFLGWSPNSIANENSTWYDPGDSYTANKDLKLYAQWYDVDSLEKWYTTVVRSGDFIRRETAANKTTEANKTYQVTLAPPTVSGYTMKFIGGFESVGYRRIYYLAPSGVMLYRSLKAKTDGQDRIQYIYTKDRTASTSSSTAIDTRIDQLQKIEDVAISYDDINTVTLTQDDITISSSASANFTPTSGYKFLSAVGWSYSNATNDGTLYTRASIYRDIVTDTSAQVSLMRVTNSSTPKVKVSAKFIEVKTKTARTTTFTPDSHSTEGASRYYALKALDDVKANYFPARYIKTEDFKSIAASIGGWKLGYFRGIAGITSVGKILGISNWRMSTADGSGISFSTPRIMDITEDNTIRMYMVCQNAQASTTTAGTCESITATVVVIYISDKKIEFGSKNRVL